MYEMIQMPHRYLRRESYSPVPIYVRTATLQCDYLTDTPYSLPRHTHIPTSTLTPPSRQGVSSRLSDISWGGAVWSNDNMEVIGAAKTFQHAISTGLVLSGVCNADIRNSLT